MSSKSSTWSCAGVITSLLAKTSPRTTPRLPPWLPKGFHEKRTLVKTQKDLGLIWINPPGASLICLGSWTGREGDSSFHQQLSPGVPLVLDVPTEHAPLHGLISTEHYATSSCPAPEEDECSLLLLLSRASPYVSLEATCSAVKTNCGEVLLF